MLHWEAELRKELTQREGVSSVRSQGSLAREGSNIERLDKVVTPCDWRHEAPFGPEDWTGRDEFH